MTISSTASNASPLPPIAAPATDRLSRERFAGLLGLNPDNLKGGDSVEISPRASQALVSRPKEAAQVGQSYASSDDYSRPPSMAISEPPQPVSPLVLDRPDVTLPAGTVVNGMVSAGPLSPGLASMTGPVPPSTGTRFLATAPDAARFGYDPIAMIRDRLSKLGVNSEAIRFERWTDNVVSPGGSRVNQYVRGTFGSGLSESFAVERVLQNPDITAIEIQNLMTRGAQPV